MQESMEGDTAVSEFLQASASSFSTITLSEVGDKTFFIAAILAMRHSRLVVMLGAMSANFIMIIISAGIGYATTVFPQAVSFYTSSIFFSLFGIKMLHEAWRMDPDECLEEYEEAEEEIDKKRNNMDKPAVRDQNPVRPGMEERKIMSPVFLQTFTLTFLGEWGDRSLFATILLSAREDVLGVITGGLLGHTACTGLAVLAGRFIAQKISLRTVTAVGGVMFLMFASPALLSGPD